MRLQTFLAIYLFSLLSGFAQAWELTGYNNVPDCSANSGTVYRILTGAPNLNRCFTFTQDMPGTGCREYLNGGASNGPCNTGNIQYPWSVRVRGEFCAVFTNANCDSGGRSVVAGFGECVSFQTSPNSWLPIRSYWCSG
ncbi:hypothetical protein QBC43DRAFT_351035 [Cladorrhinum sp. PSN259]|nr:hypothetical protein QBC43DRAFT_351035 [Cladorrhinum sp. PSN259]